MAVDGYDPITGAPQFSGGGAPDLAVDPTEVAKYAADVGNNIIRVNLAALEAYEYKRKGLAGFALDTGTPYLHNGTGWVPFDRVFERPWESVSAAPGWTAGSAPANRAEVSLQGGTAFFRGALYGGPGGTTAATLPEWARPTRTIVKATFGSGGSRPPTFIRIWANGAFQPATSLNDETEIQWSVR